MSTRTWLALAAVTCLVPVTTAHATGSLDVFTLALETPVSDGVPGPGAGNIERAGSVDQYDLTVTAGTDVYFDELSGSCSFRWSCQAPSGAMVFTSNVICSADPGAFTLAENGTYTITVFAGNGTATGTYSFTIWEINPPDVFAIGLKDVVSDGVPGPGAGNIEEPGTTDVYTFTGTMGTDVYFDELAGGCSIRWGCQAPSGATLFDDTAMCVTDPGSFTLDENGTYAITVFGALGATGTYSFTLWEVNPPDVFAIGLEETVSDGVPGPGAGNIEEPGTSDAYTFTATAGTEVYFDELDGGCSIRWRCEAPSGAIVFDDTAMCVTDPGSPTLDENGTYTITVFGASGATGTYSFILLELNPPDLFAIALEQTVSDGVPGPGAGNIEEPGTSDEYTFAGIAGTDVYFQELSGGCALLWSCAAPSGAILFDDDALCSTNPGAISLAESGTYTVTAYSNTGATGTYSFVLWEVNPTDLFSISLDEVVADGVPGPGAGNIEEPGASDVYTFDVDPGTLVCFEELDGPCGMDWECRDAVDSVIFSDPAICATIPGRFSLSLGGTYTITVSDPAGATGAYSFIVNTGRIADLNGDCIVAVGDLLLLLAAWGTPDADLNGSGSTDTVDLLMLLAEWG